jgi:hypothetical protein
MHSGGLWSETLNTYGIFGVELASGLFYMTRKKEFGVAML